MNNAITEAKNIDEVVEIINKSKKNELVRHNDTRDAEEMAGQYAWEAAEDSGYIDDYSIESHLDFLVEVGANFNFEAALDYAINRRGMKHE